MMWQTKRLQHGGQSRRVMSGEEAFSVSGQKIGVHNWTHGITTDSGRYLSPENACKAFFAKLTDNADPNYPKGIRELVVILVSAENIKDFQAKIEEVAVILPEPTFKQAADYAKAAETLAESRMIKTPQISSPAFAKSGDITPSSGRMLQNLANQNRPTPKASDPFAMIEQLKRQKAQRQAENTQKMARILNARSTVHAFIASGELAFLADELLRNMPNPERIFTAAVCFIGQDLTNIRGLLHDA